MGGDQGGDAGVLDQPVQGLEHGLAGGGVEVAGRLVGQQQARAVGQGAGNGDALLLPARQLGRLMGQAFAQTERCQHLARALAGLGLSDPGDAQRQGHVVARVELGQQVVELIDEADPGQTNMGPRPLVEAADVLAVDTDLARGGTLQQTGGVQQAGLARARRPDQAHDLARHDVQIDTLQHGQTARCGLVGASHAPDGENRLTHNEAPQPDPFSRPAKTAAARPRTT